MDPLVPQTIPFLTKSVPFCAKTIPFLTQTVPLLAQTIPLVPQTVPFLVQPFVLGTQLRLSLRALGQILKRDGKIVEPVNEWMFCLGGSPRPLLLGLFRSAHRCVGFAGDDTGHQAPGMAAFF